MFGFSKGKSEVEIKESFTFFYEDYSDKDVSEALVGRKGKSLFQLRDMDVPLPGFFVVAPNVYKRFLLNAFDNKLADLMERVKTPDSVELEKLILKADFENEIYQDIQRSYARLSGFSDAWVAVRSSVVFPSRPDISFSGVFSTELNVKGTANLFEAVKHVYLSVFKNKVIAYARDMGADLGELQMAVVVQKMVQPEVSGIAYTLDPVTNDNKRMSIEAVFGLGDVIADGAITPDQYILNKRDLDISEKHISPQEWMKIRKPSKNEPGKVEELQKIQISKAWSHQQKLEDHNIREVAKVALIVEEKSKLPQSVEWIWESGNVWILQNKAVVKEEAPIVKSETKNESVFDIAIDIVKEEKLKDNSIKVGSLITGENERGSADMLGNGTSSTAVAINEQKKEVVREVRTLERLSEKFHKIAAKAIKSDEKEKIALQKEQQTKLSEMGVLSEQPKHNLEFLLTGIGSSYGEVSGIVKVVGSTLPATLIVTKETVLLIKQHTKEVDSYILQSGGVIMDGGGLTSDVSIMCREHGIPAVVGTGLASALLKDGDVVKIDGNVGSIYRVNKVKDEVSAVAVDSESDNKNVADKIADAVKAQEEDQLSIKSAAQRAREAAIRELAKKSDTAVPVSSGKASLFEKDEKIITATKVLMMTDDAASVERYNSIINNVDGICYIDLDRLMLADKRHPMAYVEDKNFKEYSKNIEKFIDQYTDSVHGNEVIISIGSASLEQFRALVKGSSMENKDLSGSLYGVQRYLNNRELLNKALTMVKRVRNVYKSRNLSLAVHSPMNGESMREIKKEISSIGLKRTGTFNLYAVIDNPAEVILSGDILDAGIDGLILNTPRIAKMMQGLPFYGENLKYDIGVSSVQKVIESCVREVRGRKSKTIIVAESSDVLIKRSIEWGVYGVAVLPDYFKQAKKLVSQEETRMIMGLSVRG